MPFAHTCASCGLSLAHLPAPLDPHYRLPIVVCPECRTACTRRSDAHRLIPRAVNLARIALITALANTLWLILAAAAVAGSSYGLASDLRRPRLDIWSLLGMVTHLHTRDARFDEWSRNEGQITLVAWFCVSILAGAFAAAAYPHLRRRVFVPFLAALVVICLFVPGLLEYLSRLNNPNRSPDLSLATLGRHLSREIRTLPVLPATFLVAALGVPIGWRCKRILRGFSVASRRRLRTRLKKRRQGA
jgi:hypothetical protein